LRTFVLTRVDTIADMEALAIMCKQADVEWDAPTLADRLYIAEPQAQGVLDRLQRQRLVVRHGERWRLQPATERDAAMLRALVALYAVQLIPVTHLIHAKAGGSRIQEFADAFQLRKDSR
jgi:hypothetical protein